MISGPLAGLTEEARPLQRVGDGPPSQRGEPVPRRASLCPHGPVSSETGLSWLFLPSGAMAWHRAHSRNSTNLCGLTARANESPVTQGTALCPRGCSGRCSWGRSEWLPRAQSQQRGQPGDLWPEEQPRDPKTCREPGRGCLRTARPQAWRVNVLGNREKERAGEVPLLHVSPGPRKRPGGRWAEVIYKLSPAGKGLMGFSVQVTHLHFHQGPGTSPAVTRVFAHQGRSAARGAQARQASYGPPKTSSP